MTNYSLIMTIGAVPAKQFRRGMRFFNSNKEQNDFNVVFLKQGIQVASINASDRYRRMYFDVLPTSFKNIRAAARARNNRRPLIFLDASGNLYCRSEMPFAEKASFRRSICDLLNA